MSSRAEQVAIVGPGAIGLALGASVHRRGHAVVLYGNTAQTGFTHSFEGSERSVAAPIVAEVDAVAPARWVLLTTKAYQVEAAGAWLRRLSAPDAVLAVVQNGVDHVERVQPYWPSGEILPVVISMPSQRVTPTSVVQRRAGTLIVPRSSAGEAFSELFDDRARVSCTDDWTTEAWTKLLTNATLGLCALAVAPNGAAVDEPLRTSAVGVLKEIIAVGKAAGAKFEDESKLVEATLAKIAKTPEHRSSITQDRMAGRATEWDARNQVVVRTAERFGIDVPLNRALAAMLCAADAHRAT